MTDLLIYVDGEERYVPLESFPVFEPPPPPVRVWTPLQFMEEWTTEERIAFRQFAKTDLLAEDWLDLLMASNEVRVDDPRTIAGINYMVLKGVISQERADEVLSA